MKFSEIINENSFNIQHISFTQVDINNELNIPKNKRHPSQYVVYDLIQIVKKIKSKKIYGFFGMGNYGFSWNYVMFIYEKNNNYILVVYKNKDDNIKKVYEKSFDIDEFNKFMDYFGKRWNFEERYYYEN